MKRTKKIIDALISLGMSRPAARTLAYLENFDDTTSTELEKGTGLRQPKISIAVKQ
jgi:predicted transcriptional regulator